MKKKTLKTELQKARGYNELLLQILRQGHVLNADGETDNCLPDDRRLRTLDEKSEYLDQLDERNRSCEEYRREVREVLAYHEAQQSRVDKNNRTADKKLKKAIRKLEKENVDLRMDLTTMQRILADESRKQKKMQKEIRRLTQMVQFIFYRANDLKYDSMSPKDIFVECKQNTQEEYEEASYRPVNNKRGGQGLWPLVQK